MAESITLTATTRKERYAQLLPQVEALLKGERDMIASMANICAALHAAMDFFWTGFYIVRGEELVLGPFQGPVACTRIARGRGVCGTAWMQEQAIIVPDVDLFPGHIACSSASRSEIVVPVRNKDGVIFAVLDVDSDKTGDFGPDDREGLEAICRLLKDKETV